MPPTSPSNSSRPRPPWQVPTRLVSFSANPLLACQGSSNLQFRLERMSRALRPLFVTVTWGAGGSTATKSLELAEICQRQLGLTTCLHLTCTNMNRRLVDEALNEAKVLGVRNILALRGDPPRDEEYREEGEPVQEGDGEFVWAMDLVRYIRRVHGDHFCIGVAAYPEGHADESHPEHQTPERDLPHLVEKVKAGADFVMTQLFYDVNAFQRFEKMLREHPSGVFRDMPIIPGLMPIQSYQILKRTTKLSHARLPQDITDRLDTVRGDDEAVKRAGVDIVSEIVEKIKDVPSPGPRGFHFYTLNLEKAVAFILERCDLIPPSTPADASTAIEDSPDYLHAAPKTTNGLPHRVKRRQSSVASDPYNRVVVDSASSHHSQFEASADEAGFPKEPVNSRANTLAISEGEGSLGREATWDDFPNGRWGDARSPAYGEIDGYGVSLHVSPATAIRLWGHPTTPEDISQIFMRHISGDLHAIPWSEEGLNDETATIRPQLMAMNRKGWWTVASQPAVNGVRSDDRLFGWGPRGGFVFQKAFVELFLPATDWKDLHRRLEDDPEVSFYAGNAAGEFIASDKDAVNAVTWGTFPGKEIITPTSISPLSFHAWLDEAFTIWSEWRHLYPARSPTAELLRNVREGYWLVNVIHHSFRERREGLWERMLGEGEW
ncbi:MAG: hypothetical protein M1817_000547 [Caeruleum heppii]|nr:MAG: hypothetical protein M1817_000547 [Caeruleum heppii]